MFLNSESEYLALDGIEFLCL